MWLARRASYDLLRSVEHSKPWVASLTSIAGPAFGILGPIMVIAGMVNVLNYLTHGRLLTAARHMRADAADEAE